MASIPNYDRTKSVASSTYSSTHSSNSRLAIFSSGVCATWIDPGPSRKGSPHAVSEGMSVANFATIVGSLPTWRIRLNHQRVQSFAGPINGSRQSCRTGPHHHHVIKFLLRLHPQANPRCQLIQFRIHQRRAIGKKHHRKLVRVQPRLRKNLHGLFIPRHVEPTVGHVVLRQEVAHLVVPQ